MHTHMVSIEDTIEVPAEQYQRALPDDHSEDTIEIGITAFSDKLYLKFPRFGRRGTNDFCMSAENIFKATVKVKANWKGEDLWVGPHLRQMKVLRERDSDFVTGEPDDVYITSYSGKTDSLPQEHVELINEFSGTIDGFEEEDYWVGYKRAANKFGDSMVNWDELAWDCFKRRWDGNKELLLDVGKWFARDGIAVCSRTKAFFPIPEWTTPTGSYVATVSDVHEGKCPDCGADKDEHWECYSSSNRTRVPNKYKCTECGYKKSGITTG